MASESWKALQGLPESLETHFQFPFLRVPAGLLVPGESVCGLPNLRRPVGGLRNALLVFVNARRASEGKH